MGRAQINSDDEIFFARKMKHCGPAAAPGLPRPHFTDKTVFDQVFNDAGYGGRTQPTSLGYFSP